MIAFLVGPTDRAQVQQLTVTAARAGFVPAGLHVKHPSTPEQLRHTYPHVLVLKAALLSDPLVRTWLDANPAASVVALFPLAPHPQYVYQCTRLFPRVTRVALYDDLRTAAFWQQVETPRTAPQLVSSYSEQLLADAAQWDAGARDTLQRIVAHLPLGNLKQIAGARYGGVDPAHQFTKVLRQSGHAAPKRLLVCAQLAAYRFAVERGATETDAARAVGRESLAGFKRALRTTAHLEYSAFMARPAAWYVALAQHVFNARRPNRLAAAPLPVLLAPIPTDAVGVSP